MKKQSYFITATDTNIGKTYISALLMQELTADYWKPVQCGELETGGDTASVKRQTGLPASRFYPESYRLQAPLSPHLAAAQEGVEISLDKIIGDWQSVQNATSKPIIVEGAGGILVPIGHGQTLLDVMKALDLPVILVTSTKLGTFNHTLSSLFILKQADLRVEGIVINGKHCPQTKNTLEDYGHIPVIGYVPENGKIITKYL